MIFFDKITSYGKNYRLKTIFVFREKISRKMKKEISSLNKLGNYSIAYLCIGRTPVAKYFDSLKNISPDSIFFDKNIAVKSQARTNLRKEVSKPTLIFLKSARG